MELHDKALSKAKIALTAKSDTAFFTHIVFSLKHLFDSKIPTAQTNGLVIKYNPKFFMSLTDEERVFLVCHEAMHVAYLHVPRSTNFDKKRYNIASDHLINLQLLERGFQMPKGGHADKQYAGKSAEEIYYLLPIQEQSNGGIGDDLSDPDSDDEALPDDIEAIVEDILVQATIQSKLAGDKPGSVPGDIQVYIDNLLNPKLPWQSILRNYMHKYTKSDYSFKKPNRRFFPEHYLPSCHGTSLVDLAVFVDTSGSVSDHDFKQMVSDVFNIMKMMKPELIRFVQFDTEIKSVNEVRSTTDLMQIKFTGRGGTTIAPVVDWINQHKPQLSLIFTDGDFYWYSEHTKQDVIWLIHNNPQFKERFGKIIHYDINRHN